jgi:hypothetical protein
MGRKIPGGKPHVPIDSGLVRSDVDEPLFGG